MTVYLALNCEAWKYSIRLCRLILPLTGYVYIRSNHIRYAKLSSKFLYITVFQASRKGKASNFYRAKLLSLMFPFRRADSFFFRDKNPRFLPPLSIDEKESSSANAIVRVERLCFVGSVNISNMIVIQFFSSSSSS